MFFKHSSKKKLESLAEAQKEIERLEQEMAKLSEKTESIAKQLQKAVTNVGIVRFNPFREIGGDQSFTVSLLDQEKNGVIITSHYGRDHSRVYAKPIEQGKSKYSLSQEEEQLLNDSTKKEQ